MDDRFYDKLSEEDKDYYDIVKGCLLESDNLTYVIKVAVEKTYTVFRVLFTKEIRETDSVSNIIYCKGTIIIYDDGDYEINTHKIGYDCYLTIMGTLNELTTLYRQINGKFL